jgi:hypothetical protein
MNLIKPRSPKSRSTTSIEKTEGVSLLLIMAIGFQSDGGEHLTGQGWQHDGQNVVAPKLSAEAHQTCA